MIVEIITLQELDRRNGGSIPFDITCGACDVTLQPDDLVLPDKEGNIIHERCDT